MKSLLTFSVTVAAVVTGGWLLGIVLDEAGTGKAGPLAQLAAKKATRGFGM